MIAPRTNPAFTVLYDLRWMELGRAGGVEQASYELVAAVGGRDRKNSYRILAPRSACWEWDFPPSFKVSRHYSDPGEPLGERFHQYVAQRRAAGFRTAPGTTAGLGMDPPAFDLVHSQCSYINPELMDFPGVLTIQDLQHLHHPDFFSPADWQDRERLYRVSAANARHIICSSEFTRRDLIERYAVPAEKTTTIWNIPSSAVWREIPAARRRDLLGRMGVSGPFLLYPAHCWPHKNHARLVEAVSAIARELPADLKVVLTGEPMPPEHPAASLIRERRLDSRIVHLGYRSPLEVRALFQECLALVFPSLFEGFGMPVAEAIIAGKPVACSNAASLPEIAGDAAATFDPLDTGAMAARILEIATRPELRETLSAAARRRRPLFSAHAAAIRTLAVYEEAYRTLPARTP